MTLKTTSYKNFYPRLFEYVQIRLQNPKKVQESDLMDRYYERKFGVVSRDRFQYVDKDRENVVAYVKGTPIIKNPKSFDGYDSGVRIIIDKSGNLYVAKYDGQFNHGWMGNALVKAGEIYTSEYGGLPYNKSTAGIYNDQQNFILALRLFATNIIIPSDAFEWEGMITEDIIKRIKNKHPQFNIQIKPTFNVEDDYDD